jgi:hypothetical protein
VTLARYLLELYVADGDKTTERLEDAARAITEQGDEVRLLESIHVPEDETCFVLFEAVSPDAVRRTGDRASARTARVTAADSTDWRQT